MPAPIAPSAAQVAELGDELRRDLAAPDARSCAFAAREGYARVAPAAVANRGTRRWTVGYSPGVATIGVGAATELVMQCLAHVADHGGGEVTLWRAGARPDDDRVARNVGLGPDRDLLRMEADLTPLVLGDAAATAPDTDDPDGPEAAAATGDPDGPVPAVPADDDADDDVVVRDFRPGLDDEAWLRVNNAAFAGHPEQGGWSLEQLRVRRREPWFDPHWFLVAERAGEIVGFNWLRRHPATDTSPELAEIYVIGVDPAAHGGGLGRRLARLGFERALAVGVTHGLLYVAADNAAARALYESLGFAVTRTDRAYTATVVPS